MSTEVPVSTGSPGLEPTEGPLTFEELQLATRNRGMPLEALRYDVTPTGLHYRIHETPEDLAVLTPRVAQESEIWIDTETADWNTKSPRLSLVQLRLGDGSLHVLDVLSPEMAAAYHTTFAPRVIAAPRRPVYS